MQYHVRVTPKTSPTRYAVELDLTERDVIQRVKKPFEAGRAILVGGKPFRVDEIEEIRISSTNLPSAAILPDVRAMMEESRRSGNVLVGLASAQSYLVTDSRFSTNVTGHFLTKAPPLSPSEPATRVDGLVDKRAAGWWSWTWPVVSALAVGLTTRWSDALTLGWATVAFLVALVVLLCVRWVWRWRRHDEQSSRSGSS